MNLYLQTLGANLASARTLLPQLSMLQLHRSIPRHLYVWTQLLPLAARRNAKQILIQARRPKVVSAPRPSTHDLGRARVGLSRVALQKRLSIRLLPAHFSQESPISINQFKVVQAG